MKHPGAAIIILLVATFLSACGEQDLTSTPTLSVPSNTPTVSLSPTPRHSPTLTATPIPLGGGGTIFMGVNQLLIPKELKLRKSFMERPYVWDWFSSLSDGSNLTPLEMEFYGFSPDGRQMLVRKDEAITLMNVDGANPVKLDTEGETYVSSTYELKNNALILYAKSILWLPNRKMIFLVSDKENEAKSSIYSVNLDGSNLIKLERPLEQVNGVTNLLFASSDGKQFYWVTGTNCSDRDICDEKYFVTQADDSEQTQIWQDIKYAGADIYPSPSGQYIIYSSYRNQYDRGCYLATIDGDTLTKIELNGNSFCSRGSPWSPVEDEFLVRGWDKQKNRMLFEIRSAPENQVIQTISYNATNCSSANWMPDGKYIFFSVCVENPNQDLESGIKTEEDILVGQRLVGISNNAITEYPDFGYCNYLLSPDAKWAFFYHCENKDELLVYSPQMLNLETKEAYPVFEKFVSKDPYASRYGWFVFWTP